LSHHIGDCSTQRNLDGRGREQASAIDDANVLGRVFLQLLPAIHGTPLGLAADDLPVGIQIVGPQYGDYTCIHFAGLLKREFQGFIPPPGFA